MALYEETSDTADTEREVVLPPVEKDAELNARDIIPEQHFTEPPPRYTEASLIKFLEEKGIGRPQHIHTHNNDNNIARICQA